MILIIGMEIEKLIMVVIIINQAIGLQLQKNDKKYKLNSKSKILDIGCGKGFLLYELKKILSSKHIYGVDISKYAIKNSHPEVKSNLILSSSTNLPFPSNYFDFVFSINTFHNLYIYDLENSIKEMNRVAKKK